MLIGILSDSHDNVPYLIKAVETFNKKNVQLILHAGDFVSAFTSRAFENIKCKFIGIFGNNDGDKIFLRDRFRNIGEIHDEGYETVIDGKRAILLHRENAVEALAQSGKYDIIIYGHTHRPDIRKGPPLIINPGECGGWITGVFTAATLDTKTMEAEIIELK